MQHFEWCFDREAINELARSVTNWVGKGTTGAMGAHFLDVCVHSRPIKAQADPVQGAIGIKMAANWLVWNAMNTMLRRSRGTNCNFVNES